MEEIYQAYSTCSSQKEEKLVEVEEQFEGDGVNAFDFGNEDDMIEFDYDGVEIEPAKRENNEIVTNIGERSSNDGNLSEDDFVCPLKKQKIDQTTDDSGSRCSICYEDWSNSGPHRVSCLKCGHMFGRNCIDKWVRTQKKCPTCNMVSKRSDIRVLFVSRVQVVDTAERDAAIKNIKKLKEDKLEAYQQNARVIMNYELVCKELDKMKSVLEERERELSQLRKVKGNVVLDHQNYSFVDSVPLQNGRAFDHDESLIVASVCLTGKTASTDPYGLAMVSLLKITDPHYTQGIHSKQIRDVRLIPRAHSGNFSSVADKLVLTASLDGFVRIVSSSTENVLVSFELNRPCWTCLWDRNDANLVYVGMTKGQMAALDLRKPSSPFHVWDPPFEMQGPPIHSIVQYCGESVKSFGHESSDNIDVNWPEGFVCASAGGICFYPKDLKNESLLVNKNKAQCISLDFDRESGLFLSSFRTTETGEPPSHVISSHPSKPLRTLDMGKNPSPVTYMSRSTIFTEEYSKDDHDISPIVAAADEPTNGVLLWNANSGRKMGSLAGLHTAPVLQVRYAYWRNCHYVTSLSERQLIIHYQPQSDFAAT